MAIPERVRTRAHRVTLAIALHAAATTSALAQYELYWADEFDAPAIDTSVWEHQIGRGQSEGLPVGWGNNELQYYTDSPANSFVSGGMLHIVANDNNFGGAGYTSARLRTRGSVDFAFGRVEARMKLPKGQGMWPAFWMLPTNSPYGVWAASGEIDIMESVNQMTTIHGTLHFGNTWPNNTSAGGTVSEMDYSQDFHVYAIEWEPDSMRWSVDGQVYRTLPRTAWFSASDTSNPRAPFDTPFHVLLNVAVGGDFPGAPNGSTSFPQELLVDWVRVYRLAQTPFGGTPHAVPGRIEAEDFDDGWPGDAYRDCDADNDGGAYRTDADVDLEPCSEGGFNVGWICADEWLEYTVNVQQAGEYILRARVASQLTGGAFRVESDGVDISGPMAFTPTGGWQTWTTISANAQLEAGAQVLRFVNLGGAAGEYNVSWFELESTSMACGPADLAEPFGSLDFSDVVVFLSAFGSLGSEADLAEPFGVLDFSDVVAFLTAFGAGCP